MRSHYHYTRCHCTDVPEPLAVYACRSCGEGIMDGEHYVELDGEHYHTDCFEEDAVKILISEYGAMRGVADMEDCYNG